MNTAIIALSLGIAMVWLIWKKPYAKASRNNTDPWLLLARRLAWEETQRIEETIERKLQPLREELATTKSKITAIQGGQGEGA